MISHFLKLYFQNCLILFYILFTFLCMLSPNSQSSCLSFPGAEISAHVSTRSFPFQWALSLTFYSIWWLQHKSPGLTVGLAASVTLCMESISCTSAAFQLWWQIPSHEPMLQLPLRRDCICFCWETSGSTCKQPQAQFPTFQQIPTNGHGSFHGCPELPDFSACLDSSNVFRLLLLSWGHLGPWTFPLLSPKSSIDF